MKEIIYRRLGTTFITFVCGGFASAMAAAAFAQGLPVDWSHRHIIYSNPETQEEAAAKGTLHEWSKKANDPRFVLQLERKEAKAAAKQAKAEAKAEAKEARDEIADDVDAAAETNSAVGGRAALGKKKAPVPTGPQIHRDWSNVMGGGLGTAAAGRGDTRTFPAKFAFGISTKDCVSDFVVFTTSAMGASSTGTPYQTTGTFTAAATAGETFTITNTLYTPDQVLTLTADASVNTGLNFAVGATGTDSATNLANAIKRNGGTVGMTATSSGAVVTVNSVTAQVQGGAITPGEASATFSWGSETNGGAAPGRPTIFALNQLYAATRANGGCQDPAVPTQAVPAVYWSYNTGTNAVADLSPVLSFYDNGAQVAFVQRVGTGASLVLLKWSSTASVGTLGAPTTPATAATASDYRNACAAPCMFIMSLGANNSNSAPFVDYANDTLYVGDDSGRLHRFTGVFQGTPAEPVAAVSVSSGNVLSSPVYDSASQLVFVGSNCAANTTNCNRLHSVSTGGAVINSGAIGSTSTSLTTPSGGNGVRDAPIVDSTAQRVYAFTGADNGATDSLGNTCSGTCAAVYQFSTASSLASQNSGLGAKVIVGLSANNNDLNRTINSGAFDSAYYASSDATNPSGSLYVCGSLAATARRATLWRVTITNNAFSARTQGPNLADGNSDDGCSPITIFENGAGQYLFVSVNTNTVDARSNNVCTGAAGCMFMYDLNNLTSAWNGITNANAALLVSGGTGGIVIDNTLLLSGGGSQVYYSTRGAGATPVGIAVQASQAGLN